MQNIRHATESDLPALNVLYENAKRFMTQHGNPNQWGKDYPQCVLPEDIQKKRLYICETDDDIDVAFVLALGDEPTYAVIDGAWKNSEPYGTLHRIASSGKKPRQMDTVVTWAFAQTSNLRADTHAENLPMQRAFERNGFEKCGVIRIADGSERIAYQKTK